MQLIDLALKQYSGIIAYSLAVFLGFSLSHFKFISAALTRFISKLLVRALYPSLILATIPVQYTPESLLRDWPVPVLVAILIVLGHLIGKFTVGYFTELSSQDCGTFRFMCAIPNYVFLPLPICEYLWGPSAVAILVFSTLGADLTMWGVAVPQLRRGHWLQNLLSIPFVTLLVAIFMVFSESQPAFKESILIHYLHDIGSATIPLSLFLLGCHFGKTPWIRVFTRLHLFLILIRQGIIPGLFFILIFWLPLDASSKQILLLVSCMPVAIASVILAEMYHGNPRFAAEQVLLSHLLAIPTTYLWLVYALPYLV